MSDVIEPAMSPCRWSQGQSARRRSTSRHRHPHKFRARWLDLSTGSSARLLEERSYYQHSRGQGPHICILSRSIRLRMATAASDGRLLKSPWLRLSVSRRSSCWLPPSLSGGQVTTTHWRQPTD